MKKIIIGVMGPGGDATKTDIKIAYRLGKLIAQNGWVVLNGGRNVGVMNAVSQGAQSVGGLTVGIVPTSDHLTVSDYVDIPIVTGMGDARNNINVLTSDVVVVCGMNPGTASEVALAIKLKKPIILIKPYDKTVQFFSMITNHTMLVAQSGSEAIEIIHQILEKKK